MTTYYIPLPEERTTECIRLEAMLEGLVHVFEVQKITVIGIVSDDARLDPILRSLAKDVVMDLAETHETSSRVSSSAEIQINTPPVILLPSEEQPATVAETSPADWVTEEQPSEAQVVEVSPAETKPAEGERACIVCGKPVPKGRRSPTCSQKCYMKNYWETHKGNGKSARPRKQRGVKKGQDTRAGDGVVHGKLVLGR